MEAIKAIVQEGMLLPPNAILGHHIEKDFCPFSPKKDENIDAKDVDR
jgi:hypothetical protein